MGLQQEPEYQMFEAVCQCGRPFKYAAPAQLHPDYLICPECDEAAGRTSYKKWVLHLEGKAGTVFKQIELMANYRGDTTLGDLVKK